MRKTKIMVTIGPSSREPEMLDQLIGQGIDCARLNFSHGTLSEHAEVIADIRKDPERTSALKPGRHRRPCLGRRNG